MPFNYRIHHNFDVTVQNNTWCDITCVHKKIVGFHSVHYLLMSRHHPALAVMLVAVRVTVTHPTVPHLTVVRVRQLSRKAQSWAPLSYTLWCCNL